jgi:hypothetical protein
MTTKFTPSSPAAAEPVMKKTIPTLPAVTRVSPNLVLSPVFAHASTQIRASGRHRVNKAAPAPELRMRR